MGLDMYLERDTYIGMKEFRHYRKGMDKVKIKIPGVDPDKVKSVTEGVAYWRKANAIHKWFVDNAQDGVDECQRAYVNRRQLRELLDLCENLLKKRSDVVAVDELPPQSGFFFGGTEIDEGYWQDIENTVEQLKPIFGVSDEEDQADYYYKSSW